MDDSNESKTEIRRLAHDLATPLHILKFCVGEIVKNPEKVKDPDFLNRLSRSVDSAEVVLDKIRNYAKNE